MASIFRTARRWVALASVATLTACGGGGGGGDSEAAGFYYGTVGAGGEQRDVLVVVLDTGRTYAVYFDSVGDVAGVVMGNGSTSGNTFRASTVRDFSLELGEVSTGSMTSTFVAGQSISGSVTFDGTTTPFSADYDTFYDATPSLAAISGVYTVSVETLQGTDYGTVTIQSDGSMSGSTDSGCNVSGTVSTHDKGNVYDVQLVFGSGCSFSSGTRLNGHALYGDGVILAAIPNSGFTDGVLVSGSKGNL